MPFFTRASTVLLPFESTEVKVTMVPSGTAFPEQSRTGAVCTRMPFFSGRALMRKLPPQGSAAVCRTTRLTLMSPTEATKLALPSFFDESVLTYATPLLDCTVREIAAAPSTERSNFTGVGAVTRLFHLSNTKTVPLIAPGCATATRDGCARKLTRAVSAASTHMTALELPSLTTHRPALWTSSPLIVTEPPSALRLEAYP